LIVRIGQAAGFRSGRTRGLVARTETLASQTVRPPGKLRRYFTEQSAAASTEIRADQVSAGPLVETSMICGIWVPEI